jgi:hypothetical protein
MLGRGGLGVLAALQLGASLLTACGGASAKGEVGVSAQVGTAAPTSGPGGSAQPSGGDAWTSSSGQAAPTANGPVPEDQGLSPAPAGVAVASLPGFRILPDGRSLISLEVSGRVPVTQSTTAGRISYHLTGVNVPARTNRFDLPTDFFATPVGRVRLLSADGGADLVIELRAPARPTARLQQSGRGVVLRVELPKVDTVRVPEAAVVDPQQTDASPEPKVR